MKVSELVQAGRRSANDYSASERRSWPFQFWKWGSASTYSVLERKTGMEMCIVRGKREGRKLRDMLLKAKAHDRKSMCAVIREAAKTLKKLRITDWCGS